eukprot:4692756-Lingulodinium_polyedra.AAC.1
MVTPVRSGYTQTAAPAPMALFGPSLRSPVARTLSGGCWWLVEGPWLWIAPRPLARLRQRTMLPT